MPREFKKLGRMDNGDFILQVSPGLWNQIISNVAGIYITIDDPEKETQSEFILMLGRLELPIRTYNAIMRHLKDHQMLYFDGKLMSFDDFVAGVSDDSLQEYLLQYKQIGPVIYQELRTGVTRYLAGK